MKWPFSRGLVILLLATSAVLLLSVVGLVGYWSGKGEVKPTTLPKTSQGDSLQLQQSRLPEKSSPSPADEITAWKTYTDEDGIYQIRYPQDASLIVDRRSGEVKIVAFKSSSSDFAGIFVEISEYEDLKKTPEQLAREGYESTAKGLREGQDVGDITKCKVETVARGGLMGFRFVQCVEGVAKGVANFAEWFVSGNTTVRLSVVLKSEEYRPVMERILSTFKFLDRP